MLVVGLTGGIATGKSSVSKLLQAKGIPVIDADVLAREVVQPGTPGLSKIVEYFGKDMLLPDGTLDRKKLGSIVFNDEEKRRRLNSVVHPAVRRAMLWQVIVHWLKGEKICMLDVPLLIEGPLWKYVGLVVVVYCSPETQLERLMQRDNSDREEAISRINSQMPILSKLEYADLTVDNSGTREELSRRVDVLIASLERKAGWSWKLSWVLPPIGLFSAAWTLLYRTLVRNTAVTNLLLLVWVVFIHLTGIYLFTGGFLLTRLALSESTFCADKSCSFPPTHNRAVVLIVDALRFDFLSANPPHPVSPFYHNVLTLPRHLTEKQPKRSFLFNSYADPPTTTMQRLKGITTGSLPTFIDLGNNFGASSIAEDSIINQLGLAGKRSAFMGDDTWMSIFPQSFVPNMTFPYDSFNVEDLHTVDDGVIKHLFPLLEDATKPFDFLVGHFLGVDHVGHRLGPDHPGMKAKLEQMNQVLTRVVDLLDDDTLLVLLGDHGMDRSGDHGGDGTLETSAALWIYSKGRDLSEFSHHIPSGLLQYKTFPHASVPDRSIQQIDLLPTLSLLLGLPIPFNNLGSVIPELFWRDKTGIDFLRALEINTAQIKRYLDVYRSSPSGNELDDAWGTLQSAWNATQTPQSDLDMTLLTLSNYNRVALSACRAIWAQFNPVLMAFGLALLGVGLIATWSMYHGLSRQGHDWESWLSSRLYQGLRGIAAGSVLGFIASSSFEPYLQGVDALDCVLFFAPLTSCLLMIRLTPPKINLQSIPVPLILHTLAFLSNSFTFWEDRMVLFLLMSCLAPFVWKGITAPTTRLRYRILGFSLLFALCVRLISISTICREEQQPYCHVTFYSSSSLSIPPLPILLLALPAAFSVPLAFKSFLQISRSHYGQAQTFLPYILAPSLTLGAVFWLIDWSDTASIVGDEFSALLRIGRTWLARFAFFIDLGIGFMFWWVMPLCLRVESGATQSDAKREVSVIGFANTFGSSYLLFWSIFLALVYVCSQLTGQVVLALAAVAMVAFLEVVDSARDVEAIEDKPSLLLHAAPSVHRAFIGTRFTEIMPFALLGLLTFYGTGHQSTVSSIQFKSAFLLTPTANYTLSLLTVILNSFGPWLLAGLSAPLLALWNFSPRPDPQPRPTDKQPRLDQEVQRNIALTCLGMMLYYASLAFGTAVSAAILRRHLMVWKVFAPRFMVGGAALIFVDIGVLLGVGIGVMRITGSVNRIFGKAFPKAK